jgi:dolichyl-phosphate beta-glucosyltransferase
MSSPSAELVAVVPAYNERDHLPSLLSSWVSEAVHHADTAATLIVVDDGSAPDHEARHRSAVETMESSLRTAGSPHRIQYVRTPHNQGKGAAIRLGWGLANASAEWLGFIDADGAIPAREFWRVAGLLPSATEDAVCGARIRMAGRSVERSFFRHVQGRVFAACVEGLFQFGFYDTQCGLKFFRAARLRPLLPRLREARWLLDIEVLDRLRNDGARCSEVPIDCHQEQRSSLVFGVDALKIAVQLLMLRRRLRPWRRGDRR